MMSALFDHLWQSTLFACAAGLLVLALRSHSARVRYWAWFAASLKFLIPFALLESVGSWLASHWLTLGSGAPEQYQPVIATVGRIATPFVTVPSAAANTAAVMSSPIAAAHAGVPLQFPGVAIWLAGVWLTGTIVVVAVWLVRWLQLLAVVRTARTVDMAAPVPVRATSSRVEPGLVGVFRPVLLVPDGLSGHLSPQEIRTLIAHEVSHLRRRDNLTAAIHMVVEAVFWFYPLTWWLGTRLVAERERACDESVLASGHDPQIYAEGILKVCRFYIQAPLACTAGVSGADLKKRIEVIMSSPAVRRMSAATRLAMVLAGIAGLAAPVLYGLISAAAVGATAVSQTSAVAAPGNPSPIASPARASIAAPTPTPAQAAAPAPAGVATPASDDTAQRKYEQSRPQKEIPFNPADFDKFVGYYGNDDTDGFAHVYRTGSRYFLQMTSGARAEFFPESSTEFFATALPAQMSFVQASGGQVTGMVIHQAGMLIPFPRSSKAAFDAGSAELAQRIKDNTPSPGTRALVLGYIKSLEEGRPQDYDTMAPALAAAARDQSATATATVRKEGSFQSLRFAKVAPNGFNVYIATFSHGQLLWVISPLSKDGKVTAMVFRPYPP